MDIKWSGRLKEFSVVLHRLPKQEWNDDDVGSGNDCDDDVDDNGTVSSVDEDDSYDDDYDALDIVDAVDLSQFVKILRKGKGKKIHGRKIDSYIIKMINKPEPIEVFDNDVNGNEEDPDPLSQIRGAINDFMEKEIEEKQKRIDRRNAIEDRAEAMKRKKAQKLTDLDVLWWKERYEECNNELENLKKNTEIRSSSPQPGTSDELRGEIASRVVVPPEPIAIPALPETEIIDVSSGLGSAEMTVEFPLESNNQVVRRSTSVGNSIVKKNGRGSGRTTCRSILPRPPPVPIIPRLINSPILSQHNDPYMMQYLSTPPNLQYFPNVLRFFPPNFTNQVPQYLPNLNPLQMQYVPSPILPNTVQNQLIQSTGNQSQFPAGGNAQANVNINMRIINQTFINYSPNQN